MTTVYQGDKLNLIIPQGATYQHTFTYTDADGNIVDLTGYTAKMQVRASIDALTTLYDSTTLSDFTVSGPIGQVTLVIPSATTTGWTWRYGVYDIEIVAGDGKVTRLVKGTVKVDPAVTR